MHLAADGLEANTRVFRRQHLDLRATRYHLQFDLVVAGRPQFYSAADRRRVHRTFGSLDPHTPALRRDVAATPTAPHLDAPTHAARVHIPPRRIHLDPAGNRRDLHRPERPDQLHAPRHRADGNIGPYRTAHLDAPGFRLDLEYRSSLAWRIGLSGPAMQAFEEAVNGPVVVTPPIQQLDRAAGRIHFNVRTVLGHDRHATRRAEDANPRVRRQFVSRTHLACSLAYAGVVKCDVRHSASWQRSSGSCHSERRPRSLARAVIFAKESGGLWGWWVRRLA